MWPDGAEAKHKGRDTPKDTPAPGPNQHLFTLVSSATRYPATANFAFTAFSEVRQKKWAQTTAVLWSSGRSGTAEGSLSTLAGGRPPVGEVRARRHRE